MRKIVIALLGMFMVAGLLATPVISTSVSEPTSIAKADTYTTVQHHCYSSASRLDISARWGSRTYIHVLSPCEKGPSGVNGGHIPTHFYLSSGWCAKVDVYNNGRFSFTYAVGSVGWHQLYTQRHSKVWARTGPVSNCQS